MQKDSAMRLLIVDDRVEDAEAIVSALRNGGIAVRPLRPQNTAELEHMVASQPVDLVLAAASVAMPLEQVQVQVAASGKDLPLLLLVDRIEEAAVLGMAEAGLRALELVLAIYRSAATHAPVKLPLADCATTDFCGRFGK